MISQDIHRLIIKYLTRQTTLLERNKLEVWLENYDNYKLFKEYVKTNYLIDLNMEMFEADDSKKELLELIHKEKKQYRFRRYTKYAAAAVIVFGLGYFFKDSIFNTPIEPTPIIVNTNTIIPGTDKATLTLANGEQVPLEKGASFQTQNANSNGEEIIYKAKQNVTEIAYNYLTTPRGGQFYVKLSDGTQVWLNSESRLKYPVTFANNKTREIELVYGEAYFDISPSTEHNGTTFRVINQAQEVEVLGTEFNIKAYKNEPSIFTTLIEGKVAATVSNKTKILSPNQQLKFDVISNKSVISKVNVYHETSWKNGVFSFKNKPLKDIMKTLSRWYEIEVVFDTKPLEEIVFSGSIKKRLSITDVLDIISNASDIHYDINGKIIALKKTTENNN